MEDEDNGRAVEVEVVVAVAVGRVDVLLVFLDLVDVRLDLLLLPVVEDFLVFRFLLLLPVVEVDLRGTALRWTALLRFVRGEATCSTSSTDGTYWNSRNASADRDVASSRDSSSSRSSRSWESKALISFAVSVAMSFITRQLQ